MKRNLFKRLINAKLYGSIKSNHESPIKESFLNLIPTLKISDWQGQVFIGQIKSLGDDQI